jgi:hypothetical protein
MLDGDAISAEYIGLNYAIALDLHLYHYAVRDGEFASEGDLGALQAPLLREFDCPCLGARPFRGTRQHHP